MEEYPAVQFMVKHGRKLAILVGLALPVLVVLGILVAEWHWVWGIAALVAGAGGAVEGADRLESSRRDIFYGVSPLSISAAARRII